MKIALIVLVASVALFAALWFSNVLLSLWIWLLILLVAIVALVIVLVNLVALIIERASGALNGARIE